MYTLLHTFMLQRSEWKRWCFLLPMGVLWSADATRLAIRLSGNSTQPSVKLLPRDPAFFLFFFTTPSAQKEFH